MDVRNWCSAGIRTIHLGRCSSDGVESGYLTAPAPATGGSTRSVWKQLRRKFRKEKRKVFVSSGPLQIPYDSYSYSQNFDEGPMWDEPDSLSRSFSARFADIPSRIFVKQQEAM